MKMKTAKENKLFNKIIDFYLLNCPVVLNKNKVCVRAKSFAELGFCNQKLSKLLKVMNKDINNHIFFDREPSEHKEINLKDVDYEIISCVEHSELKKTKSIFYAIRNGLAHGQYQIKQKVIVLEPSKNNNRKAFIRLRMTTLIKWIGYIKNGQY